MKRKVVIPIMASLVIKMLESETERSFSDFVVPSPLKSHGTPPPPTTVKHEGNIKAK